MGPVFLSGAMYRRENSVAKVAGRNDGSLALHALSLSLGLLGISSLLLLILTGSAGSG